MPPLTPEAAGVRSFVMDDDDVVRDLMQGGPRAIANARRLASLDPGFMARVVDATALLHRLIPVAMRAMIDAGADVNVVDAGTGCTLLNAAVCARDDSAVRYLLTRPGVALDLAPPPVGNMPLANAVRMQAYDIVDALLEAGARCGPIVYGGTSGRPSRLLLQDAAMPMATFERLLPFAELPARRDAYLRAFSASLFREGVVDKVTLLVRRYGAPVGFVTSAFYAIATSPDASSRTLVALVRAFIASGGDPCAFDAFGRSLFAAVQCSYAALADQLDILLVTFDVNFVRPGAFDVRARLAHVDGLDRTREAILARADLLGLVWAAISPYAHPLPDTHVDAITRYTGLAADAYLALRRGGGARARVAAARGVALRMLYRWYAASPDARRDEARARFWGMLCAFVVLRSPALLMWHRTRVMAAGARRLRALGGDGDVLDVLDHVTNMAVEVDDAHRVRMFCCSKVWDVGQHPAPRFCVDVVHFAQHMSMRGRPLATRMREDKCVTLNGIEYDAGVVGALARVYLDYKARVDPGKESWVALPASARFDALRASTFEERLR